VEHRGSVGVVPKLEMHRQSSCTQRTETCRLRHYAAADTQTTTNAPAALLAVFALAPDPAVGVHAFAAELAAEAPDAVMLGDAGAPAVLAGVPHAVMFADGSPCTSRGCARTRAVAACPCHACGSRARGASLSPACGRRGTEVVKRNHGFVEPVVANGEVSTGAPLPVRRRRERDEEHKGMSFGGPPAGRGTAQGSKLSSGTQKL